jgi:hypothetical protein
MRIPTEIMRSIMFAGKIETVVQLCPCFFAA